MQFDAEENHIEVQATDLIYTFGGICSIDDYEIESFGISIEDFTIDGLSARQMRKLMEEIKSHLEVCGEL